MLLLQTRLDSVTFPGREGPRPRPPGVAALLRSYRGQQGKSNVRDDRVFEFPCDLSSGMSELSFEMTHRECWIQ